MCLLRLNRSSGPALDVLRFLVTVGLLRAGAAAARPGFYVGPRRPVGDDDASGVALALAVGGTGPGLTFQRRLLFNSSPAAIRTSSAHFLLRPAAGPALDAERTVVLDLDQVGDDAPRCTRIEEQFIALSRPRPAASSFCAGVRRGRLQRAGPDRSSDVRQRRAGPPAPRLPRSPSPAPTGTDSPRRTSSSHLDQPKAFGAQAHPYDQRRVGAGAQRRGSRFAAARSASRSVAAATSPAVATASRVGASRSSSFSASSSSSKSMRGGSGFCWIPVQRNGVESHLQRMRQRSSARGSSAGSASFSRRHEQQRGPLDVRGQGVSTSSTPSAAL